MAVCAGVAALRSDRENREDWVMRHLCLCFLLVTVSVADAQLSRDSGFAGRSINGPAINSPRQGPPRTGSNFPATTTTTTTTATGRPGNWQPSRGAAGTTQFGSGSRTSASQPPRQRVTPKQPAQRPIATRQESFSIPFQVASFDDATVVELHVSADQGRNWYVYARQRPQTGRFQFNAKRDGEYWFASRTIRGNSPANRQPVQPQLRMLVDTTRPELKIDGRTTKDGQVTAQWSIFDRNLEAKTLKIEYQTQPNTAWIAVPEAPQNQVSPTRLQGQVTWSPSAQTSSVLIRVEIRDVAGNVAAATQRLVMPQTALRSGGADLAQRSGPGSIPWNANEPTADEPSKSNGQHPGKPQPTPYTPYDSYRPVAGPTAPPVQDQYRKSTTPGLPPGQQAKWTPSSKFMLEYDVDSESEQVASVELWVTRDGGQQWQRWGTDPDRRSPMPVQVDRPGVYGFRIVVVGKNGLVGDKPKAGDKADIWIGVDQTKPTAQLTAVEAGKGADAGTVIIRWAARDDVMGSAPITIQYRSGAEWQTIARDIANTGQFRWRPTTSIADKIDVRLIVRDQAGNVNQVEAKGARLNLSPQGRINGFNPVGQ